MVSARVPDVAADKDTITEFLPGPAHALASVLHFQELKEIDVIAVSRDDCSLILFEWQNRKVVGKKYPFFTPKLFRDFHNAYALNALNHPHIAKALGCTFDPPMIVTEHLEGGDAWNLSLEDGLQVSIDIASALICLHDNGYVHRDIKNDNVVLFRDEQQRVRGKLIDFEFLTKSRNKECRGVGTRFYMDGELSSASLEKSDCNSFGVFLLFLFLSRDDFLGLKPQTSFDPNMRGYEKTDYLATFAEMILIWESRNTKKGDENKLACIRELSALIMSCVNRNPQKRPHMKQIKKELIRIKIKYDKVIHNQKQIDL